MFVGYSDLTTVLAYLTTRCDIVSFHGPMLDRRLGRGHDGYDRDSFLRAVTEPEPLGEIGAGTLEAFCTGEAAGPLMGGTLAQLVASLGTPYAFSPPRGYVLFLEDAGERPFRLDRMLTQLRLAGVLKRRRRSCWASLRIATNRAASYQPKGCSQSSSRTSMDRWCMDFHLDIQQRPS